jgi:hypothetical protein
MRASRNTPPTSRSWWSTRYVALSGILRITEATDPRVVGTFTWEGSSDPRDPATRIRVQGAFHATTAPAP